MNSIFCNNCARKIQKRAPVCPYCLAVRDVEWGCVRHPGSHFSRPQPASPPAWTRRFRLIDKAGGAGTPHWRRLAVSELLVVFFNPWALLLGPLYFFWQGMWRHALAVAAVGLVPPGLLALLLTGVPALDPGLDVGWGVGLAVWLAGVVVGIALRANRDVYGYWQGDASLQRRDAHCFSD